MSQKPIVLDAPKPEPRARTLRYAVGDTSHPAAERFLADVRAAMPG